VGGEFAMKLLGSCEVVLLQSTGDLHPKFTDSPFEDDFRRI
jgi:hypothetical protein